MCVLFVQRLPECARTGLEGFPASRDKESLRVEVYLLQLTALRSSAPDQKLPIQLSIGVRTVPPRLCF